MVTLLHGNTGRRLFARTLMVMGAMTVTAATLVRSQETAPPAAPAPGATPDVAALFDTYCSSCHNDIDRTASLSFDDLRQGDVAKGAHADIWERILTKMERQEMPPRSKEQPGEATRQALVSWLQTSLDAYARAHPDPGRATVRRLNRVEYANAVHDLLGLDVDVSRDLPQDNSGYGFDNIADVLSVSPTLVERYVLVAGRVARLATGLGPVKPFAATYDVPKDGSIKNSGRPAYNDRMSERLPTGSRGGGAFDYYARASGTYEVAGWLNANTNNEADRLTEDRVSVRVPLKAGAHVIGLSFRKAIAPDESVHTLRNTTDKVPLPVDRPVMLPMDVSVDGAVVRTLAVPSYRLSPRYAQQNFPRDVMEIDVLGPYDVAAGAPLPDTPSRRRIFTCHPANAAQEQPCARRIITTLARRAYRRPVDERDIAPLMATYDRERRASDFNHGVEAAVEAILVSPHFLFAVESDPAGAAPGTVHPLGDLELATRLSLFLWSSIPDEQLLGVAQQGRLHEPAVMNAQITRMLADPRAQALTRNFAGQWLYLRNLDQQRPDTDVFPQFDVRLRAAMSQETELFFTHVLQSNRSVLDFLSSDYTFLNARLARHYGITGVNGTAMRLVHLDPAWHRGGLLGQASVLTVTSYGNHTSVVKRGKWVLENLLAAAPPPPPPNVPALKEAHDGKLLTARQQMELHRADPACASCHVRMDPMGFSLENYDAVGAWRTMDVGQPIDSSGILPDGTHFSGLSGLQRILLDHREQFVEAFTARLMTYALSRGLGPFDQPQVRAIARAADADGDRIQTIIRGIVASDSFRLKKVPEGRPLAPTQISMRQMR
jgi:mono/diheme cytochrome c family protein